MARFNRLNEYEILPCPFCNGKEFELFQYGRFLAGAEAVKCSACGCIGPYQFSDHNCSDIVRVWNKRVRETNNEVDN